MITADNCMKQVLAIIPDFQKSWEDHLEFWGDDEAGLGNDVSEFSRYVAQNLDSWSPQTVDKIFAFVEECLIEGDKIVQTAFRTSFLENLLNRVSSNNINSSSFVPHLRIESRKFCKDWDEFTGVRTPGL